MFFEPAGQFAGSAGVGVGFVTDWIGHLRSGGGRRCLGFGRRGWCRRRSRGLPAVGEKSRQLVRRRCRHAFQHVTQISPGLDIQSPTSRGEGEEYRGCSSGPFRADVQPIVSFRPGCKIWPPVWPRWTAGAVRQSLERLRGAAWVNVGDYGEALPAGCVRLEPFLRCFEWFARDESHSVIVEHGRAPSEDFDDG